MSDGLLILKFQACLVQHKAHIVKWTEGRLGGWVASRCIHCGGSPQDFERASSYPFLNVHSQGVDKIYAKLKRKRSLGHGEEQWFHHHRFIGHRYLKRFGLSWPQIRDASWK